MTREIKFRGKDIETGEWEYGSLFQALGKYPAIAKPKPTADGKLYYCLAAVNPDTVGQYTGLKDRNGKEIFEGDILVQEIQTNIGLFKDYFEARWESAGFIGICLNNESKGFTDALESCTDYIVCGNIHDNPELLEEEK